MIVRASALPSIVAGESAGAGAVEVVCVREAALRARSRVRTMDCA